MALTTCAMQTLTLGAILGATLGIRELSGADATPPPVTLQGVATPLSRLFLQFPVCSSSYTPTKGSYRTSSRTPVADILALSQVLFTVPQKGGCKRG